MAWEPDWEASFTRLLGAVEQIAQTVAHAAETVPALAGVRTIIARVNDDLARARAHITPPPGQEPLAPLPATALGVDLHPMQPSAEGVESETALGVPVVPAPKTAAQPVPLPPAS